MEIVLHILVCNTHNTASPGGSMLRYVQIHFIFVVSKLNVIKIDDVTFMACIIGQVLLAMFAPVW